MIPRAGAPALSLSIGRRQARFHDDDVMDADAVWQGKPIKRAAVRAAGVWCGG